MCIKCGPFFISMQPVEMSRAKRLLRFATRAQRFQTVFRMCLHPPSELEQPCRALRTPQRNQAGSTCQFECSSETEQTWALFSIGPAKPNGPEHPLRAPSELEQTISKAFAAPTERLDQPIWSAPAAPRRARAAISSAPAALSGLERPFREALRLRAGSSGHIGPAHSKVIWSYMTSLQALLSMYLNVSCGSTWDLSL